MSGPPSAATPARLEYVDWFQHRVIQDALTEATAAYWHRRAKAFDHVAAAATGTRLTRAQAIAQACRNRAQVALLTTEADTADLITCCLNEARAAS